MNVSDFKINTKLKKYKSEIGPLSMKIINVEKINFSAYYPFPGSNNEFFLICGNHSGKIIAKGKNEEEAIADLKTKIKKNKRQGFKYFVDWKDFVKDKTLETLRSYARYSSSKIKELDKAGKLRYVNPELKLLPKKKGTFYRGIRFYCPDEYKNFIENHKEGNIISVDSLSSTSSERKIAESFARMNNMYNCLSVLMEIDTEALYNGENQYGEKEYLLVKGTKLKIKEIKEVDVEKLSKKVLQVKMEKA